MKQRTNKKQSPDPVRKGIGDDIDTLIRADLDNWKGKEVFFRSGTPLERANEEIAASFQANKVRNAMVTKINHKVHGAPPFHFRNHHNY